MSEQSNRRRAGRSFDPFLVVGGAAVVAAIGLGLLVDPDEPRPAADTSGVAPTQRDRDRSSVICPAGPGTIRLSNVDGSGRFSVYRGEEQNDSSVQQGATTDLGGKKAAVLSGTGELATGAVAARVDTAGATECPEPSAVAWFPGVGAGATHASVLELVNPDTGPASVDVIVHSGNGVVEAPGLRGISVAGRGSATFDLAQVLPRRDELTLEVVTNRGRVQPFVRDAVDELGSGPNSSDWLAPQAEPRDQNVLLGLPVGKGNRYLTLMNPSDSQTRATVSVLTEDSVFVPEGAEEVTVGPNGSTTVLLSEVLPKQGLADAVGLVVDAPTPLVAGLRSFVEDDLTHTTTGPRIDSTTAVMVPGADSTLILGDVAGAGSVRLEYLDGAGKRIGDDTEDLVADRGYRFAVPKKTALVRLEPKGTQFAASVLSAEEGARLVRALPQVRSTQLPHVQPGQL